MDKKNYDASNSLILSDTPLTSFSKSFLYSFNKSTFSSRVRKLLDFCTPTAFTPL